MSGAKVLSVSYDRVLLGTRNAVLRYAGYTVLAAKDRTTALELISSASPDLIIIGNSVSRHDRDLMIQAAREHTRSPILLIRTGAERLVPEVEAEIDNLGGPTAFLETVASLIGSRPKPGSK